MYKCFVKVLYTSNVLLLCWSLFACLFSIVPCTKSKGKAAACCAHALMFSLTYSQRSKYGEWMTKVAKVIKYPSDFMFPKHAA